MNLSSFYIYNASAGSGKTFTLVKEYLKLLVTAPSNNRYKYILALTFTNKAVGEMKSRIIDTLKAFASESIMDANNSMFEAICKELNIPASTLQEKSEKLLQSIMHNYASFDISTIDKFTQKLIRTFAYDLRLPLNFEVALDTEYLLSKAIDNLIAKAGTDSALTNVLVAFALEKADDDKSWDITYDFKQVSKLLVSENDLAFVEQLKGKNLQDFVQLKTVVREELQTASTAIIEAAELALELIDSVPIEHSAFNRGLLPKYFIKLQSGAVETSFNKVWQTDLIEGNTLYPKKVTGAVAASIESLQPQLSELFLTTKQLCVYHTFLKNFYKNITPLSVLNEIRKELEAIKSAQNVLLISEFNTIISKHIKAQPAPFIYERIGEKFKHYFIDEFQDTSVMQWENLVPLIDNVLSGESASAFLVGDAKQAIYRWRGGKAEQFIDLYNHSVLPFQTPTETRSLDFNYRSFQNIVQFNNQFFGHLSNFAFSSPVYQNLYETSQQTPFIEHEGYVSIDFVEVSEELDRDTAYSERTLTTVQNCLERGYELHEICVLVRKKKEGIAIAEYLTEQHIPIISSETLLVANAPEVQFMIQVLQVILDPKNNQAKAQVLEFLMERNLQVEDPFVYLRDQLPKNNTEFFSDLAPFGYYLNVEELIQLPIYEAIEQLIFSFRLTQTSNAYLQFFLDFVLDFSQSNNANIAEFLTYFEEQKEQLTIVSPEGKNALQIMTIHKSKGLEFPVVIFPFADLDIYRELNPMVWLPIQEEKFNGFSMAHLNYNQNIEQMNEAGATLYAQHQAALELDNINLLYVALTRPVEQLCIITQKKLDAKGQENLKSYSGLFIHYLKQQGLWDAEQLHYEFGVPERSVAGHEPKGSEEQSDFISIPKKFHNINIITNSGYLWDTKQESAIEKGNLIHLIMSNIHSKHDVLKACTESLETGILSQEQHDELFPIITKLVQHQQLASYYEDDVVSYNERDIIGPQGEILRPDRLVFTSENTVVLIDYKTGTHHQSYVQQLDQYQQILENMQLKVTKRILVYINDVIEIKEV